MSGAVLGWLIRDVFRRARASGFLHIVIATVVLAIAACFSSILDSSADEPAVRQFLFRLAVFVGDIFGVLIVLLATAGFLPAFLDPAAATVLLSKPPSRGFMLVGRFIGVTSFVALFSGLLVAGTAMAVGLRTGVWPAGFWLAWPLLAVQFVAFASAGTLIAVTTRNAVAVMLGTIFFALISWGISFGRHFLTAIQIDEARPEFGRLVGWVYWILPKPVDCSLILHDALGVPPEGLAGIGLRPVLEQGLYNPVFAVITTLAVAVVLLGLAVYELNHQDY